MKEKKKDENCKRNESEDVRERETVEDNVAPVSVCVCALWKVPPVL